MRLRSVKVKGSGSHFHDVGKELWVLSQSFTHPVTDTSWLTVVLVCGYWSLGWDRRDSGRESPVRSVDRVISPFLSLYLQASSSPPRRWPPSNVSVLVLCWVTWLNQIFTVARSSIWRFMRVATVTRKKRSLVYVSLPQAHTLEYPDFPVYWQAKSMSHVCTAGLELQKFE